MLLIYYLISELLLHSEYFKQNHRFPNVCVCPPNTILDLFPFADINTKLQSYHCTDIHILRTHTNGITPAHIYIDPGG